MLVSNFNVESSLFKLLVWFLFPDWTLTDNLLVVRRHLLYHGITHWAGLTNLTNGMLFKLNYHYFDNILSK